MLQDKTVPPCRDCHKEWVFTIMEQALAIERHQENDPSRCPECRDKRKARRDQGLVHGHNGRQDKKAYTAVCAQCGGPANLPFKPRSDRPVYCQACHQALKQAE